MRVIGSALAVATFTFNCAFAFDDPPAVAPDSGPWDAETSFSFQKKEKKTRRALSGIACPASTDRLCLAVFDEGGEARYLTMGEGTFAADAEAVVLLPGEEVELDGEGAATDGAYYYATGSHSAKRSDCADNPDSRHVMRFRLDAATGRGERQPAGDPHGALVEFADTGRLWDVMQNVPGLADHVGSGMCLGGEERGINIEGLAVADGRLFFGLRGPAESGAAGILGVDADALFAGGDADPVLSTVTVGEGRAVRDLVAVRGGFLVLAGPDDDEANEDAGWIVAHWSLATSGATATKPLAALDLADVELRNCDEELKPEAMAVVEDEPGKPYKLVIFSDGMCDGGPLAFTVPR